MVLPLYASLEKMDHSYIEASLDLGASQTRTFFTIVMPLAKVGIVSGIIITFIPALGSFLTPDLLGGKKVLMIANVIDNQFKDANDWPFGAALSLNLMYITFFVLALRAFWSKGSQMEAEVMLQAYAARRQGRQARAGSRPGLQPPPLAAPDLRGDADLPLRADRHPGGVQLQRQPAQHRLARLHLQVLREGLPGHGAVRRPSSTR